MSSMAKHQPQKRKHRFVEDQTVEVDADCYQGLAQVRALLPIHCSEHDAPKYGCSSGDAHFSFCEECLKPTKFN